VAVALNLANIFGVVADVRTSVIYEHLRNHAVAPAGRP
jgi:hypothetical protein